MIESAGMAFVVAGLVMIAQVLSRTAEVNWGLDAGIVLMVVLGALFQAVGWVMLLKARK